MKKELRKNLKCLIEAIIEEAENNEEFANKLSAIFEGKAEVKKHSSKSGESKRRANRRDKAIIDPITLAENGTLTKEMLREFSEKELKDIIADYAMDSSKLAMKWKDKDRLIQLIIDTSLRRASKGDAFRGKDE